MKGVFYDASCQGLPINNVNHAMTIVGYGTNSNGDDYWIVRNSWGSGWGDNGHILTARNKGNNCNIASWAMYPNV